MKMPYYIKKENGSIEYINTKEMISFLNNHDINQGKLGISDYSIEFNFDGSFLYPSDRDSPEDEKFMERCYSSEEMITTLLEHGGQINKFFEDVLKNIDNSEKPPKIYISDSLNMNDYSIQELDWKIKGLNKNVDVTYYSTWDNHVEKVKSKAILDLIDGSISIEDGDISDKQLNSLNILTKEEIEFDTVNYTVKIDDDRINHDSLLDLRKAFLLKINDSIVQETAELFDSKIIEQNNSIFNEEDIVSQEAAGLNEDGSEISESQNLKTKL